VKTPEANPADLAGLAVNPDRGSEAVEVPAAEGAVTVDGDDGEVGD